MTERSYATYLEEEVLRPLGLEDMVICDNRRIIPHMAEGYAYEDGELIRAPYLALGVFSPSTGGLCATAGDLVRWTVLLHGGQVVAPDSYEEMTSPTVTATGDTINYGYGLAFGSLGPHRKIAHGGSKPGFNAYLSHYPEQDLTIAVLANAVGGDVDDLEEELARVLLDVRRTDLPLAAAEAARYVGDYVLRDGDMTRDLRVFLEN